jgi:HEAT repeat protein
VQVTLREAERFEVISEGRTMRVYFSVVVGAVLSCCCGPVTLPIHAAQKETETPEEQILRLAKIGTDDVSLLKLLRKRSEGDADLRNLDRLVGQLGSDSFREREEASAKLKAMGPAALSALQQGMMNEDAELARRSKECIDEIWNNGEREIRRATVRMILRKRPRGMVDVLVRYLPYAGEKTLENDIYVGIDSATREENNVSESLVAALGDEIAERRALAACVVGARGGEKEKKKVQKLLLDVNPLVRLRAAQGLLAAGEKEAVPALITLLKEKSIEIAWQAEELLEWLAGDEIPVAERTSAELDERKALSSAWEKWWRAHSRTTKIPRQMERGDRYPAVMLMVDGMDNPHDNTRIWVTGCSGRTRWALTGLRGVCSAQWLPNEHLLIGECSTKPRVTERSLDGKIQWQRNVIGKLVKAERLANGDTIIITEEGMEEIGVTGECTWSWTWWEAYGKYGLVKSAAKLSDGRYLCASGTDNSVFIVNRDRSLRFLPRIVENDDLGTIVGVVDGGWIVSGRRGSTKLNIAETGDQPAKKLSLPSSVSRLLASRIDRAVLLDYKTRVIAITDKNTVRVVCTKGVPLGQVGSVEVGFTAPVVGNLDKYLLSFYLASLRNDKSIIRMRAVEQLQSLELPARTQAIPALVNALTDSNEEVSQLAHRALVSCGVNALPELRRALTHENRKVREIAIESIGLLSSAGDEAVPALIRLLKDESRTIRLKTIVALGNIGPGARKAIPVLLEMVKDKNAPLEGRQHAIRSLGAIRVDSVRVLPVLVEMANNPDLALWAADSLGGLEYSSALVAALVKLIKLSPLPRVRIEAARSIGRLGSEASIATPDLIEALDGKGIDDRAMMIEYRRQLICSLRSFGPPAKTAIPRLIKIVKDQKEDISLRIEAIRALQVIGPANSEIRTLLRTVVADNREHADITAEARAALNLLQLLDK